MIDGRSVAEEVYFLIGGQPQEFVLEAALVGAALGELRLLGRIDLDDETLVRVLDPAPTGYPVLDALLARLATEEARSPYGWVEAAGDEVRELAGHRVRSGGLEYLDPASVARQQALRADLADGMVTAVKVWLRDRERDSRLALLGRVLWAAEQDRYLAGLGVLRRRELARAADDDWAAMLPRNAWGYAGLVLGEGGTPQRFVPVTVRPAPRRLLALLAGAGAALAAVAVVLHLVVGATGGDLRGSGVAATALVREVQDAGTTRANYDSSRLLLEYRYGEGNYITPVRCVRGCGAAGEAVRIWHDPGDPTLFVTEWGDASRPDEGNPLVWVPGLAGGVLILAALVVFVSGRMRGA